ncbi:lysophospholipid acyltransferase family protein [Demetria terragena]|uniref:lysophospholipid acyltransferase family protein n=1 Tax=Demetria terragena TaxID=63959 RepID=UPI0003A1B890|nr:lysophospholipid acyltransferase family protein [Demetria terragena]
MAREPMREDITPMFRRIIAGVRPVLQGLTRQDWSGGEYLPREGGFVIAANHVSYVDPFALGHFLVDHGRAPRFLAKDSLFDMPGLGAVVRGTGQIPVKRNTARAGDAFAAAVQAVRDGACVTVMPEATLSRDPGLWPMTAKSGAARIALETGCPLIPAALWGPQDILWPYDGMRIKVFPRKTMHVHAGPPLDLSDLAPPYERAALRAATDRLMAAITTQLEKIRHENVPVSRVDFHGYLDKSTDEEGRP